MKNVNIKLNDLLICIEVLNSFTNINKFIVNVSDIRNLVTNNFLSKRKLITDEQIVCSLNTSSVCDYPYMMQINSFFNNLFLIHIYFANMSVTRPGKFIKFINTLFKVLNDPVFNILIKNDTSKNISTGLIDENITVNPQNILMLIIKITLKTLVQKLIKQKLATENPVSINTLALNAFNVTNTAERIQNIVYVTQHSIYSYLFLKFCVKYIKKIPAKYLSNKLRINLLPIENTNAQSVSKLLFITLTNLVYKHNSKLYNPSFFNKKDSPKHKIKTIADTLLHYLYLLTTKNTGTIKKVVDKYLNEKNDKTSRMVKIISLEFIKLYVLSTYADKRSELSIQLELTTCFLSTLNNLLYTTNLEETLKKFKNIFTNSITRINLRTICPIHFSHYTFRLYSSIEM